MKFQRAGHAAAPTFRNDTASRPSSVTFGDTSPYTPGGKRHAGGAAQKSRKKSYLFVFSPDWGRNYPFYYFRRRNVCKRQSNGF